MDTLLFENVSYGYGAAPLLRDVSFRLAAGEFVCLLGSSGAGKTTLLRLVAGLEHPDSGRIRILGQTVADGRTAVPAEKRRVGFVFQDFALFPHLSVLKNVMFGMPQRDRKQAMQWLERVGLGPCASCHPHELSGGQKQRVALVRALAHQPEILLLDEPFSNLDAGLRPVIRSETRQLAKETGTTVLMVTHDLDEAVAVADRHLLMRAGRVTECQCGTECLADAKGTAQAHLHTSLFAPMPTVLLPVAEGFEHTGEANERRAVDIPPMSTARDDAAHGRSFMRQAITLH
jgi:iron(III) transport system ATP-binding protein